MKVLVTGAQGFLGGAILRELRARGHEVVAGCRREAPELEQGGFRVARIELGQPATLASALQGCEGVVHAAARTGVWGPRADYFGPNVLGTRHLLAACRAAGVGRLVHTSSPSVCFDGRDHVRASNDLPYARHFLCAYPESKAVAEREVLAASGRDLATCALRPHLVIGAGDPHLLPRLIERARARRLIQVGDGTNEVSVTHVTNAARAHALALERLEPGAVCAGRAFFAVQEKSVLLWAWIGELLARLGLPPIARRVSLRAAHAAGAACELAWSIARIRREPPITRFTALQLGTTHTYDLAPLRAAIGYAEAVSLSEATDELVRQGQAPRPPRTPSPAPARPG